MAYNKTTWIDDTTFVNATNMNKIESGIETNETSLISIQSEVDINTAKTGISAQQSADILTNNAKLSYTDGAQVTTNTADIAAGFALVNTKEDSLGNPIVDGEILSSLIDGTRSWIANPGSASMMWKGPWIDGTYNTNEVTRDGEWTMIATTTTTDRPAPQENGLPERDTEDVAFFDVTGFSDVVKMVHNYTMTKSGWMQGLWVKTPEFTTDTVVRVVIANTTTGEAKSLDNLILNSVEWTLLGVENLIITTGDIISVAFSVYNKPASGNINGNWKTEIGTVPASGQVALNNGNNPTSISYSYTDDDTFDRTAELDGVQVGSIIEISEAGDLARNVQCEVTVVDTAPTGYVTYTVITISSDNDVRDNRDSVNTINGDISVPTHYYEDAVYRPAGDPSWATVTSELYIAGVNQNIADSAFGIDIQFQEATVSDDWDLIALSSSSGSSSNTEQGASYDFAKFSSYTNATDVYTQVGTLVTPTRPPGTYEFKISMTWSYTQLNSSAYIRWSTDGGNTWEEIIAEPKDTTDRIPVAYFYPIVEATEFIKDIQVEGRAGNNGQTLAIDFLDIIYDRKI